MKQLLERWAELAPEECARDVKNAFELLVLPKHDTLKAQTYTPLEWPTHQTVFTHSGIDPVDCLKILYAVLMCCEARGWWAMVDNEISDQWEGGVDFKKPNGEWCTMNQGRASNPAEAALAAYIKALEATQ